MKDLEKRVAELERLVRELIQWKEDRQIIQIDKNGKEIGFAIHNYHMENRGKEIEELVDRNIDVAKRLADK